jgi:hypothetical protein
LDPAEIRMMMGDQLSAKKKEGKLHIQYPKWKIY